ncbi:unnamed protein product, partial [Arabidopsis halleri]
VRIRSKIASSVSSGSHLLWVSSHPLSPARYSRLQGECSRETSIWKETTTP